MRRVTKLGAATAIIAAGAIGGSVASAPAHEDHHHHHGRQSIKHVLLISVDGLHQSDVSWYVANHPGSEIAMLVNSGAEYSGALTPIPSDSFPGMVGQVTGGNPSSTGIYYDAEYNHNLLPAGTTSCAGKPLGAEVNYFEIIAKNPLSIDSGQGLPGLPGHPGQNDGIMQLTGQPSPSLIDPTTLPVDPKTCARIYPHQYLKVNTVFNVLHDHHLLTAWSDKHVAYEILSGPSGNGIDDLFAPEINSNASKPDGTAYGGDWTQNNDATIQYDSYKVQAVLNEIDGWDHSHTTRPGVPAIFGMNFQTVSTAEKLPTLDGTSATNSMAGGYLPGTHTPGPLLSRALDFINTELTAMDNEIHTQGVQDSTAIIVSAKHGQSPQDPNTLTRIDDGKIIDGINAGWKALHPSAGDLVAQENGDGGAGSRDDAFPLWLTDRSQAAADFVKNYLLSTPATGSTYNPTDPTKAGPSRTLPSSGLTQVFTGEEAADYFGVSPNDPRHPDVWGVVQHGVVYTGKTKKIAEHGGADFEDRNVPIIVYAPGTVRPDAVDRTVETTQIAPTILRLLGFDPEALEAVRIEGTQVLPGIARGHGHDE